MAESEKVTGWEGVWPGPAMLQHNAGDNCGLELKHSSASEAPGEEI